MESKSLNRKFPDAGSSRLTALFVNFIVIYFVYNALLQTHFSPDTFAAYSGQYEQVYWQISLGRFVHGIVYHILLNIGLGIISHMPEYTLLFMVVSAWCAFKMADSLCRTYQKDDPETFFLCDLAFLIAVVNICILEWYLFPEAMVMYALALWGATQGALVWGNKKYSIIKRFLFSFTYLFIAINSYQAILGWYVTLALMAILSQNDFYLNKCAFGSGICVMFIGGVNSILNQVVVKVAQSVGIIEGASRHVSFSLKKLMLNGIEIFNNQKDFLKNGYHLLPDYFPFILLLLGIILVFFSLRKNKVWRFVSVGIALGSGYLLTLAPHLLSSSLWITLRTLPTVFVILSLLLATAILCGEKTIRKAALIISLLTLLINSQSMSVIITDHMTTIHTDIAEGKSILRHIEEYEKENNILIEEIFIMPDEKVYPYYPGVKTMWMDINLRHLTVEWEKEPFLELLSGRDFSITSLSSQEAEAIVQGRDWQFADYDEQITFDGNRAYVILY